MRKTVTNNVGFFSVTPLPAGTYDVTVEAKGFGTWQGKGVVLNSSDSKTMNIDLQLATVAQSVEVSTTATQIALIDSTEKSALITSQELQKLTLLSRNATEFVKLLPGATFAANQGGGAGVNTPVLNGETVGINGFVANGTNAGGLGGTYINSQLIDITQDGQNTFDPGAYGNATPVNPNPDMISEVKVLTASFTAENARGPVVINTLTKSGEKNFHGEARLNARNDALNSNDWFNKQNNLSKTGSSYYYPGFNFSGPVIIPGTGFNKSRTKMFFFNGFELYRQSIDAGVVRAFVPTEDMYAGRFTQRYDVPDLNGRHFGIPVPPSGVAPDTSRTTPIDQNLRPGWDIRQQAGCTITAGVLSPACIDPNALWLMKRYLPAANADPATHGGFNYVQAFAAPQNSYQNMTRVDTNFTDNTKLYVIYSRQRETANMPLGLWNASGDWVVPAPTATLGKNTSDNLNVSLLHVFSPTMTSETRFGYTKIGMPSVRKDQSLMNRSELASFPASVFGNPETPALGGWGGSVPNLGDVGHNYTPSFICEKGIPSVETNLTKVIKNHSTKYGFYWQKTYNKQDNWGQYMGVFSYATPGYNSTTNTISEGSTVTGNSYADMLMGIGFSNYFEQAAPPPTNMAQNIAALFAQDTWRVNRWLSINYGMRFEHYAKPYANNGVGLAIFNPAKYDAATGVDANSGVSWHSLDPSIPLSGAKSRFLFYSPRFGASIDVFKNGNTIVRGGWGKYRAYDSLQSNSYVQPAQTAFGSVGFNCNNLRYPNDWIPGDPIPGCSTWENLGTRTPPTTWGTGLGAGRKGITIMMPNNDEQPLVTSYSLNINQVLPAKFSMELSYVGNNTQFSQATANINYIPLGTMHIAPNVQCNSPDCTQPYRPYYYQGMTASVTAGGAQYDSFQASLRRSMGWVTLQTNYTFSKAVGSNGWNNSNGNAASALPDYGARDLWGILPFNRAHALSLAYLFELPKVGGNKFFQGAINGWEISGVTVIQTGTQVTNQSPSGGQNFNYGRSNGPNGEIYDNVHLLGTPDVTLYPDLVCNPTKNLKPEQYVNGACFAPAPVGRLGATAHTPYMPGPLFWNSDLSLRKNFKVTEKQAVQFTFSMFNFMNHGLLSFNGSDANLNLGFNGDGTLGNLNPRGGSVCPGPNCNAFGYANSRRGHRTMELGVKYTF